MTPDASPARKRRQAGPPPRRVERELLDELPPSDPQAIRSRRDLRRVNAWMGNVHLVGGLLRSLPWSNPPRFVAEIGGGDGSFMLKVAQGLQPSWTGVKLWLVDRQNVLGQETNAALEKLGWALQPVQADVFDWLANAAPVDLIVANLFLHHFDNEKLAELFRLACVKTRAFVATEPRRFPFPAIAGLLVRLIGCNAVTRHDAAKSVQAGFTGKELSALWPVENGWQVREAEAGWFSHGFCAWRSPPDTAPGARLCPSDQPQRPRT